MKGKRIISLIISLSLMLSMFSFQFAATAEEEIVSEYQMEIDFLKEIDLLAEDFDASKSITRGEMAQMIVSAVFTEVDFSVYEGAAPFADVPSSHPSFAYIKACKELGIVNGDYNNNFNPDNTVTIPEFLTVVINALGYTPYATAYGGYPTGYFFVAKSSGISTGVDLSASSVIADVAAKILYNAIFADSVELKEITNGSIKIGINEEKNYLSDRLGIYEYDAVVVDNGYTALYGSSIEDPERIVIEEVASGRNITAFVNGTNAADYLGYRVKIFIRNNTESGKYEVVFVAPRSGLDVVTISADSIVNSTTSYIEYEKEKNAMNTTKLNLTAAPKVLFNGVVMLGANITSYIPNDGLLTFINNDNDSVYEFVNILSFNYDKTSTGETYTANARNIVVDTVITDESDEYINCKFNPGASIDLDSDYYIYKFVNSEVTSLEELKEYDIVSVAECPNKINGRTMYYLVVSREIVEGKVVSKDTNTLYLEDGSEYELSNSITSIKATYISRIDYSDIRLYIDATGKVAYTYGATKVAKNYAYMIGFDDRADADAYVFMKVFTKEGTIEDLTLSSRVTIDGVVCDTIAKQKAALATRYISTDVKKMSGDTDNGRPIIFDTNSNGLVTKINTDTPDYAQGSSASSDVYIKQTSIPYTIEEVDDPDTLKAGWRNGALVNVEGKNKTAGGKFFITMDTLIMAVPKIDTYGLEDGAKLQAMSNISSAFDKSFIDWYERDKSDDSYKILTAGELSANKYDIQAYDIDPDTGIAAFAVLRGEYDIVSEYYHTNKMGIYSHKTTVYDTEKGKEVTKIYYYMDGTEQSAVIDTEECYYPYRCLINGSDISGNPYSSKVEALEPGDIIRVDAAGGKIKHIERVVELDKVNASYPGLYYPTSSASRYTNAKPSGNGFPFDCRNSAVQLTGTYVVNLAYTKSITGTIGKVLVPAAYNSLVGTIDPTSPSTYNEQYFNYAGLAPMVVTIGNDGTSLKVKQGTINDIITVEQAENDLNKASLVITKYIDMNISQMIVINGIENLAENRISN